MKDKLFIIAITFLATSGLFLGYALYNESQKYSELRLMYINQQNSAPKTNTIPDTTKQTATETKTTSTTTTNPTTTVLGREAFGPQISPDGKWILTLEETQNDPSISETQSSIILKGLFGQGSRVVASSNKIRLEPAGWSADGLKFYYSSKTFATDGCGGAYPELSYAGDTLYEVILDSGKRKTIFETVASGCGNFFGLRDVHAAKNMVVFEEPSAASDVPKYSIYTSDLIGRSKKLVTTISNTQGITAGALSPDGTKIAIVQNQQISGFDYTYKLFIINLADGTKKEVAMPKKDGNYFSGWVDNNTISFNVGNKITNIAI